MVHFRAMIRFSVLSLWGVMLLPVGSFAAIFESTTQTYKDGWELTVTRQMILSQELARERGDHSIIATEWSQSQGQGRARQMAQMAQTSETEGYQRDFNIRANQVRRDNPQLETPGEVIAAGYGVWVGRNFSLVKNENLVLNSRVELRSRTGIFEFKSSLIDSQLSYTAGDGASLGFSREFAELESRLATFYRLKSRSIESQLSHYLTPSLSMVLCTAQYADATPFAADARLVYSFVF